MRLKHKVFSWLLLFSMLASLLPQTSLPVFAADESSYKQMTVNDRNSKAAINITENTVLTLSGTNTIASKSSPIQVADGVTLSVVLAADSDTTLTCTATEADVDSVQGKTAGIYVPKTATLNIRNADDSNPGKLTVKGGYGGAGIGGGSPTSAYEDKDPGKAGDGNPGLAVNNYSVNSTVIKASKGYGEINGTRQPFINEDPVWSVDSQALAYAKSLAPTSMKDTPGGTGGANGKNAADNTQDCGTVYIKSGTIYAYGGQGGAGIGGGIGVNGENGGDGNPGSITDEGTAYGRKEIAKAASTYRQWGTVEGIRAIVKSSVAGSSGGGAGGNGGNGGRGSNGGDVTIDGGTIVAVGGKNGTATAAGIGGGVGGNGGNGGNGGDGGDADANGLAGRGGDGQAGYAGSGGNSGDAGTLTINGGKVIAKGNNGFGVGNYGTAGSNGTSKGRASSAGTAGGQGWTTWWENVQESYYSLEPVEATRVYSYEGIGGSGGNGGKSTKVDAASGNPGTAGINTINKTDSNIVFMDENGNVSSKNLPTNGKVKLYEYNLLVKNISGAGIEGASVKVKDANGNVIAQSASRTADESKLVQTVANDGDISTYSNDIATFATSTGASRYKAGVATLWLPAGSYTLSGDDVSKGGEVLAGEKTIVVRASLNGSGGSSEVYIGDYNVGIDLKDHKYQDGSTSKFSFPDTQITTKDADGKITGVILEVQNAGEYDLTKLTDKPVYTGTQGTSKLAMWRFTSGKSVAETEKMIQDIVFTYADTMKVKVTVDTGTIFAKIDDASKVTPWIHPDGSYHYYLPVDSKLGWAEAYNAAKTYTYANRKGYLLTTTSVSEGQFANSLITLRTMNWNNSSQKVNWTGITRLLQSDRTKMLDPDSIPTGAVDPGGTGESARTKYYWVGGPEHGENAPNGTWAGNQPTSIAFAYGDSSVSSGGYMVSNSNVNSSTYPYVVEFGGYDRVSGKSDPGGYQGTFTADDIREITRTIDQNGSVVYKYVLNVKNINTNQNVEGAVVRLKVPSPDDDPSRSYIYMEEQGGVTTDKDGNAVLWLPEGTYTLSGDDVKAGNDILVGESKLTVKTNNSGTRTVFIGTAGIGIELKDYQYSSTTPNKFTFPNTEIRIKEADKKITGIILEVQNAGEYDLTNVTDKPVYTGTQGTSKLAMWRFTNGKTITETENLVKNILFTYGENMKVKVTVDYGSTFANITDSSNVVPRIHEDGTYHYYLPVNTRLGWAQAYNAAKTYTYAGRKGYLLTTTSVAEGQFANNLITLKVVNWNKSSQKLNWTALTRLLTSSSGKILDPISIPNGATDPGSTGVAARPRYYWAGGPEYGENAPNGTWAGSQPTTIAFTYTDSSVNSGGHMIANANANTTETYPYVVEFGGYEQVDGKTDPGGYNSVFTGDDIKAIDVRKDQNGTPLYKYVLNVQKITSHKNVEGAEVKIKVPSPDADESKAYIYMEDQGGVKTDSNGNAVLWLPEGTYTLSGDDVKSETDTLFEESKITVKTTDDGKSTVYIGTGGIGIQLKDYQYSSTSPNQFTFPNTEILMQNPDDKITGVILEVQNAGEYDLTNVTDKPVYTGTQGTSKLAMWRFTEGKTIEETENIIKNILFSYGDNMKVKVTVDHGTQFANITASSKVVPRAHEDGTYHYYLPVDSRLGWAAAYNAAKTYTYASRKGYLLTTTSTAEGQFANSLITLKVVNWNNSSQKLSWTGLTRLLTSSSGKMLDPNSIPNGAKDPGGTGESARTKYYWVGGPEYGENAPNGTWAGNQPTSIAFSYIDSSVNSGGHMIANGNANTTETYPYVVEFGGYDKVDGKKDPGGYYDMFTGDDIKSIDARKDHNGTPIYKYVANVKDVRNQNNVEGAVIKIKVPSPDGDPNKAYVYMGDQGGVTTDADGNAVLWLPAGTYNPGSDEIYKEEIGGLNTSIDASFVISAGDNSGELSFWIGESDINVKLNTHDIEKDENGKLWVTFPYAEYISAENATMLTVSISNVADGESIDVSKAAAVEDWDMTDLVNQTYIWVFGTDRADKTKVESIMRSIRFPYSKDIKITVEADTNETSDSLKKENSGTAEGYKMTRWENNGHFYMVKLQSVSWGGAYNLAKSFTFGGRKGYLATGTTKGELDTLIKVYDQTAWVGNTALILKYTNDKIKDADSIDLSQGHNTFAYQSGFTSIPWDNANKANSQKIAQYHYWACGPEGVNSEVPAFELYDVTESNYEPNKGGPFSATHTETAIGSGTNSEYESCGMTVVSRATLNDTLEGSGIGATLIEFGGYREGQDPGKGIAIKRAKDERTITELEAYYTYPVVDANNAQKDTYADKQAALEANGGYKATLTTAFKEAVAGNTDYAIDADTTWTAGTALPNPIPEAEYTYDMGKYPVISVTEMFKDMAELAKLDLSQYTITDTVQHLTDMFTNTGKATDGFPAVGLASAAEAAKFNDETQTGIDKTKLYFGNVTKVDGETQPGYRYDGNATSIDLETAGVESYTITGTGGEETLTEADLTADPYTFDLNKVFSDDDKANATAGSLRTTVTIVKVMAQQNLGVEAYFNADMTTENPSAAIMRGAWANESEGYVDFYVRDVDNADGKISVENLKKLKVTADLAYGFENVAAFQTGDKADWYKNILESDLTLLLAKADGTETDIATLSSENNPTPVMFAPAVDNSVSETEDKTEVKDNTADNTEEEASGMTDETISEDNAENAESADTADTDENAAEEPKAEEATEPNTEEETENADISLFSNEDDIALMALTYLDDAEIVTFTDANGDEQKYTRIRVKVSNVLASGIVTFKLSYNTGTDADAVYEAINSAEYDVIVPGDVDKDGVVSNDDSLLCIKIGSGILSADEGRTGNYLFELADLDRDHVISNDDALNCVKIGSGLLSISNK